MRQTKKIGLREIAIIILSIIATLAAALFVSKLAGQKTGAENLTEIKLVNSQGKQVKVLAEIVDTPEKRSAGLMYREKLGSNRGMFFIFEREQTLTFWMKNTLIPLDMIFMDGNYKIVDINENAQPCESGKICMLYVSRKPAKYVLEVNAGFVEKNNLKTGDRIIM